MAEETKEPPKLEQSEAPAAASSPASTAPATEPSTAVGEVSDAEAKKDDDPHEVFRQLDITPLSPTSPDVAILGGRSGFGFDAELEAPLKENSEATTHVKDLPPTVSVHESEGIREETEVLDNGREPVDMEKVQSTPSSSSSSTACPSSSSCAPRRSHAKPPEIPRMMKKKVDINEWCTLSIGPFQDGIICEILEAWYGIPNDFEHQVDVTEFIRKKYSPKDGLQLSNFNKHFHDPAKGKLKRMVVEYKLTNTKVKPDDVSRAKYSEGTMGHLQLLPAMTTKALANMIGAAVAAGGFAAAKAVTQVSNWTSSDNEKKTVADSGLFQGGFMAWMHFNGIWPTVKYCQNMPDWFEHKAEDMKQTPFIVSNHICYLDGPILAGTFGAPKIIAMKGTLDMPLFGRFGQEIGVIEVDREDKDSRAATIKAITDHYESWKPGQRPLLLFPEGRTSNGDSLLPFKKGAFIPGGAVRPVVLHYTGNWHPANTNFKETSSGEVVATGDGEWMEQFFGTMVHSLTIKVLPPYRPSAEELENAQLYADNVREVMDEAYLTLREELENRPESGWQATKDASKDLMEDISTFASGAWSRLSSIVVGQSVSEPHSTSATSSSRKSAEKQALHPRMRTRPSLQEYRVPPPSSSVILNKADLRRELGVAMADSV